MRRVGGLEPLPHRRRSLGEQFQIEMPRNGRTQADAGRKIVVAFGAVDQPGEAAFGEFRAGIVDGALDHFVIAAQHQHVGDRAAQYPAGRNRHQMRLALVARGLDQRLVVEPFRLDSTGAATSIRSSNASARTVSGGARVDRGEAIGEQRLGGGLDVMDQALEHVVEQPDLFVRKIDRAVDEEVGDPAQGFDPARDGAVRKRGLQFVEQAFGSGGGFRTHDSILESFGYRDRRRFLRSSGNGMIGSGTGDAVASSCLGFVERAVGAREKGVRAFHPAFSVATPAEMVTCMPGENALQSSSAMIARSRSSMRAAASWGVSGSTSRNSSPP